MGNNVRLASHFLRDLERIEIDVWNRFYRYANEEVSGSCGIDIRERKSLSVLMASKLDILALNRAIGLGFGEPATDRQIEISFPFTKKPVCRGFSCSCIRLRNRNRCRRC